MLLGPLPRFDEGLAAKAKSVVAILPLPKNRLLLEQTEIRLEPARVVRPNRCDEPVVGQLQPGGIAPFLPPNQMGRFQGIDGRIVQPFAPARLPHYFAPNARLRDERAIEPLANRLFLYGCPARDFPHMRRVIFGESRIDIANGRDLFDSDLGGIASRLFPELRANHLEMDGLPAPFLESGPLG